MNSLSWLIYAAEISGNIGSALGGFSFFLYLGFFILLVGTFGCFVVGQDTQNQKIIGVSKTCLKYAVITFVVASLVGLVSQFIPTKNTLYAIAASEMGEVVVKTPEAQEVLQALKGKILEQLEPTTKE